MLSTLSDFGARTAIVLGSSLGGIADAVTVAARIPYRAMPNFPVPAVSGHAGQILLGTLGGVKVMILNGRAHAYEQGNPAVMRPVLETVQQAGVRDVILTNAAGSLRVDMRPGRLMLITDHINFSGMNPLVGETGDSGFVSMTDAYSVDMGAGLRAAARRRQLALAEGVYIWFSGPSFETPAEIRAARALGADAVGMSTVPETILARRFGLRVAALSVITNLGAGLEGAAPSHKETKEEGAKASSALTDLLTSYFENSLP